VILPSLPSLRRRSFVLSAATAAIGSPALAALRAGALRANALPDFGAAPEFAGIERWLNSEPLSLARLRGRVVLVDFWTYACVNCVRTLPHVNRWASRYEADGLTVVGVHTPEFPFERSTPNLEAAIRRLGVRHAVAQDNRYATWKAYDNQYWPAAYLVDARGRIRYKHFGEGEYERTESVIQALLAART
jgi:thiol-disulfide isomerase/thioredoxin